MSLSTHSRFYYGYTVDSTNNLIDFFDGGSLRQATMTNGAYSPTEYAAEVARAMTEAGSQDYACVFTRATRKLVISAAAVFKLLITTGVGIGTTAFPTMGFTGADLVGLTTYTSNAATGSEYVTQFILQSYVSSEDLQGAVDATVNKSASGRVEVFSFGDEKFIEMNFRLITNIAQAAGGWIRNNATGVEDMRAFIRHLVKKAPVEFMPDENDVNTFETFILEKTPTDSKGVGYRLKELYDRSLPGYFETGVLTMRVIE